MQQLRMQIDHTRNLLRRELLPNMMHQISQHTHDQRPLQLPRRDTRAQQDTLVQQRVDLPDKVLTKVRRQNVPRRHQQLLARHRIFRRAVLEETHIHLGQQVRILPHDRR